MGIECHPIELHKSNIEQVARTIKNYRNHYEYVAHHHLKRGKW